MRIIGPCKLELCKLGLVLKETSIRPLRPCLLLQGSWETSVANLDDVVLAVPRVFIVGDISIDFRARVSPIDVVRAPGELWRRGVVKIEGIPCGNHVVG